MRKKETEYWVSTLDEHGDLIGYSYQGAHKGAALKAARELLAEGADVSVERVTRCWDVTRGSAGGEVGELEDVVYEDVVW
jgi:hypothetical protein